MKKKYLVIALYCTYVAVLFVLARQYEYRSEHLIALGFNKFGESLGLLFSYLFISFFSSYMFLIMAHVVQKTLFFRLIFIASFLLVAASLLIGLGLHFLLWITQLDDIMNSFQQIFIVAALSTMGTTLWLLGNIFKVETEGNNMQTT